MIEDRQRMRRKWGGASGLAVLASGLVGISWGARPHAGKVDPNLSTRSGIERSGFDVSGGLAAAEVHPHPGQPLHQPVLRVAGS